MKSFSFKSFLLLSALLTTIVACNPEKPEEPDSSTPEMPTYPVSKADEPLTYEGFYISAEMIKELVECEKDMAYKKPFIITCCQESFICNNQPSTV